MPTTEQCATNNQPLDSAETDTPVELLQQQFASLEQSQAKAFDPVRFHFINSMLKKAEQQPSANNTEVAQLIANKALVALDKYQADFNSAQATAKVALKLINDQSPEAIPAAEELFEQCKFKALDKLVKHLTEQSELSSSINDSLKILNESLTIQPSDKITKMLGSDLDHHLQKENDEILQSLLSEKKTNSLTDIKTKQKPSSNTVIKELRSSKRLRHKKEKQSTEKIINKAITESPDDAGPLNPQRLALRTLTSMQELSPVYVNRLIGYIDSLLWLEQAAGKINKASKATSKKNSRRK